MKRRDFIGAIAGGTLGSASLPQLDRAAENAERAAEAIQIKIVEVEPIMIRGARGYLAWNLVRVRTNQAIDGIGEGFAFAYSDLGSPHRIHDHIKELGEQIVGANPLRIGTFLQRSAASFPQGASHRYWVAAITAIEIALWDIFGKATDLPIHALIGGQVRDRIPLYANHGSFFTDDLSRIDVRKDFDGLVERVLAMKQAGFKLFKWDPFWEGDNPGRDAIKRRVEAVARVREAVGPNFEIGIDAHGRFNLSGAILAAKAMEPFKIRFFEEPVHFSHPEQFASIAGATSIPLATGEHLSRNTQVANVLRTDAIRYLQPEIGNIGGILETTRIAAMAEAFGLELCPHNYCGPIVTRALMQVCSVIPNLFYMEYAACGNASAWERALIEPPNQVEHGQMIVPMQPGLGFALNEDLVRKRRIK